MANVTAEVQIGREVVMDYVPKPGHTDYTNIKYVPVISCVIVHEGKILLIQRSQRMRFYPGYWGGVSGFLDEEVGVREKAKHEINEEAGIEEKVILKITEGKLVEQPEPAYQKIWAVHPVRIDILNDKVRLDWEGQDYCWLPLEEVVNYKLLPGFMKVLEALFPKV